MSDGILLKNPRLSKIILISELLKELDIVFALPERGMIGNDAQRRSNTGCFDVNSNHMGALIEAPNFNLLWHNSRH
jgi:hypothetical protein